MQVAIGDMTVLRNENPGTQFVGRTDIGIERIVSGLDDDEHAGVIRSGDRDIPIECSDLRDLGVDNGNRLTGIRGIHEIPTSAGVKSAARSGARREGGGPEARWEQWQTGGCVGIEGDDSYVGSGRQALIRDLHISFRQLSANRIRVQYGALRAA